MKKLEFAEGYFLSSKNGVANVVCVINDDSNLYRFTGTTKELIEKLYAKSNYEDVLVELNRLHPDQAVDKNEAFLKKFIEDLKQLGILAN